MIPRNIQHEDQVDYVLILLDKLEYTSERMPFVYKGPDIKLDNTWVEVKAWDSNKPSYVEPKYWRRLIYSKILSKSDTPGIYTNTLETPVGWRDYLRSNSVYSVFLDPNETEQKHLQKLKVALRWVSSSLHSIGTGDIDLSYIEIKFLLEDVLAPFEVRFRDQIIKSKEEFELSCLKIM